ncbi:ubiquinol-cytochrome-c reductase complex assembly factor 2-like [Folsomia candida]|uniref:ubiquinol-cytochrome-c reductase complex assembly factor 2-like n=1 Tax=Folsomia candida TaxID=158441 RepID=UPI000B8FBCA3|nr:ubiquinol-cytochrome-c reductase complex assembly factor 2-like [Folsomia candida]
MTSTLYRSFLRVLEKWPVEPTKKGRDLGQHIRLCVAEAFRGSDPHESSKCQEIQESLNRIASNKYNDAFYVSGAVSSSGLSQSECQQILSNEFLKLLAEKDKGNIKTLKEKFLKSENKDN